MSALQQHFSKQTWRSRIKRWRRGLRARLSRWAASRYGTPQARPAPLSKMPERILVCRLNTRLGNVLFLTPLLASLAATFPNARIDVLLRQRAHVGLLRNLPGIDRVWALPDQPGLHWLACIRLIRRLRKRRYDLAIDPNVMSVSNRIGVLACGARQRLGFAGDNQWLRLDYAAPEPRHEPHQALQALHLLRDGFAGLQPSLVNEYRVAPGAAAQQAADRYWQTAFAQTPAGAPVVGFFIQATGNKQLPEQWWRDWLAAVQTGPKPPRMLQLLPPGNTLALAPELACIRVTALDELAACLARLDLFVAADSGPMHLAAAAGAPTLGLFGSTDPEHYRPLGPGCSTVSGNTLTPEHVAERTLAALPQARVPARTPLT